MRPCYLSRILDSRDPQLSIIVVARNLSQASACFERLRDVLTTDEFELVVVSALDCSALNEANPGVRIVAIKPTESWPRARAAGLRAAAGSRLAVLSEDYLVGRGWLSVAIREAAADVVVGEVHSPRKGIFARAAYLWEYLHVAPPAPGGQLDVHAASCAPAGAVVYRREGLDIDVIGSASSEIDYHRKMFEAGRVFSRDAALSVRYSPPRLEVFLADRRGWSRDWARRRARSMATMSRLVLAASRLALPPFVCGRYLVRLIVRPRHWAAGLLALPYAVIFSFMEMMGEIEGYLRSRA